MKPSLPLLAALLAAALLPACASFSSPSPEAIAKLPVVKYGQAAPENGEFVLYYPANTDLPVLARIDGNLFSQTARADLKIQLKQDVYVYRNLVSLDGKSWENGQQRIGGQVTLNLPGDRAGKRDARSPGELAAEFTLK